MELPPCLLQSRADTLPITLILLLIYILPLREQHRVGGCLIIGTAYDAGWYDTLLRMLREMRGLCHGCLNPFESRQQRPLRTRSPCTQW